MPVTKSFGGFFRVEKQIFRYDDIGIVSRVRVNGRLFLVPKEELDALVSTLPVILSDDCLCHRFRV
jgi:hypothetical protein